MTELQNKNNIIQSEFGDFLIYFAGNDLIITGLANVWWVVQQQCGLFWPCGLAGGLCDVFIWRKTGFVDAPTTTLALFASRLESVLLLLFWASKIKVRTA